jgi:hypothetical protein
MSISADSPSCIPGRDAVAVEQSSNKRYRANRFWMRVRPVSVPTLQQNSVRSSNAHD